MNEFMYGLNSLAIAAALFAAMAGAVEAGHRVGRRRAPGASDSTRAHVGALQGSLLGILALLLGFTFSLALQRYDSRSAAVVDEANAIGTAYLRAQLLPASVRGEALSGLKAHLDARVAAGATPASDLAGLQAAQSRSNALLDAVWGSARRAVEEDPSPVRTGLFVQALNEVIDAYGRRDAQFARHVPEEILLLLYATFAMTSGVVGYAAGLAGHRPSRVTYVMLGLIVVLAFVILDLDRPRRGFVLVDQGPLLQLQAGIVAAQAGGDAPRAAVTGRP